MAAAATTLRIDPLLKERLTRLSQLRRTPMNKLVAQALEQFVAEDSLLLQAELEASIAELRRLRQSDPDFEDAIGKVARAELSTDDDPAQGQVSLPGERRTTEFVRGLLGA